MRTLSIAWKDTRHVYRNVAGLALMLVAPLLLATALGAAFGTGDNFSVAAVKTVVADRDGGAGAGTPAAGALLTAALTSPGLADLLAVTQVDTADAARAAVDDGDADVAVIIPAGLSAALMAADMSGQDGGSGQGGAAGPSGTAEVQVYKDPALNIGPSIVTAVVQAVVQTMNGARAAALTSTQLAASVGYTDPAGMTDLAAKSATAFSQAAETAAPVVLETRSPATPGADIHKKPNVASQVLVGMMIFFMLFGAATPARSILDEHRQGTLSRLFTTPTSRTTILGGKYIAVFFVVLLQSVILLLAGWLLLGARWGEIGPVIVLTLCGALVASSLGLVTVSFARTPAQAGAVSSAIFVFLGLMGGNFVGSTAIGGTFATVRRITPNGWLLEGWDHVLFGGSWDSIALPAAVSVAFSLAFFALATFFFRRRYA
jgi:ABC-2 type transport system permease protein